MRCWAGGREKRSSGFSWATEKEMAEQPVEKAGRSSQLGQRAKSQERRGNPFLFSFPIFQSHFPKDFEFSFVFEVNHSV
jgi:hypothetical protein